MLWPAVAQCTAVLSQRGGLTSPKQVSAIGLFGPLQRFGIVNICTNEGKELSEA